MTLALLAQVSLGLAVLFAATTAVNLRLLRPPPHPPAGERPRVSLLVPARDEEANIGAALDAALASAGVELEVVVLDDGSTDGTARLVAARAAQDPRLRLVAGPPLPPGWNGKQHACHRLAAEATHDLLVFMDADVRLRPDALARLAAFARRGRLALASGVPRQETRGVVETLYVPMIQVLLLGYLPLWMERIVAPPRLPGLAAGCGQLMAVGRADYRRAGGHAAVRASRHDGVTLPRAFRRRGLVTGLCDATGIATCRMYRSAGEVWEGFSKNATEGMATPVALPIWTVLLAGGHVAPCPLLAAALGAGDAAAAAASGAAVAATLAARVAIAWRSAQGWAAVALHPAAVLAVLALQWWALARSLAGRPARWRGRAYPG